MRIASPSNGQIKAIRALRGRKERERTGLFLAEGLRVVRAALEAGAAVETLVVAPELLSSRAAWEAVAAHRANGGRVLEVTASVFRSLSSRDGPLGLAAVTRQRWESLPPRLCEAACWVALSGVQHPGNLGSILRSCDASGAAGVILVGPTTDPYDPAAVRASMGTLFSQRIVRAGAEELAGWVRRLGCCVVGTSADGATDYRAVAYRPPLVLLMGAEGRGLPAELLLLCDAVASIPMLGRADSLNLAVATSLLLYEVFRRR